MYTRLWWKDARQLWPIWLFLAMAAAVGQWLALKFWLSANQHSMLIVLAIMWASFYAVSAGAAAFAGEREAGTLRLLDIMPVEREVAWAGKVSFALVTTLLLASLLSAMAALGAIGAASSGLTKLLSPWDVASLATIVLEALGWGLLWSAVLSSALSAAVVAIFCTGISWLFLLTELDTAMGGITDAQRRFGACWFGIALVAIGISYIVFSRRGLPRRSSRLQVSLRSPVVVVWTGFRRLQAVRLQVGSPGTITLPQAAESSMYQVASVDVVVPAPIRRLRPSLLREARALAWQTSREGLKTWCLLTALVLPFFVPVFVNAGAVDHAFLVLPDIGIALAAGVSVFGLENRAGTQRFLNYHAAHPGLVWLVKLATWCLGLAAIWGPHVIWATMLPGLEPRPPVAILSIFLASPIAFAVAQLCGMAIRRGITALIAALILTLALALPLLTGVFTLLVPLWGPPVLAIALLFVSWAWSRDWLQSRPAPGRWLRLGFLFVGTMLSLSVSYVGYRVLSVRDVSLVAAPVSWIKASLTVTPADRNAAELYRLAGSRLKNQHASQPAEFLKENSEALALIRRAATQSECQFRTLDRLMPSDGVESVLMDRLAELVMLDTSEGLKNGNLSGVWDDVMLLFQMARHFGEGTAMTRSLAAWRVEREALGLAMEWAVAPKQTPERLRAALAAYRALPQMIQASDVVRAEAHLTEKTLSLPPDELRTRILLFGSNHNEPWRPAWVEVITLPWEIARAQRVNRAVAAAFFQTAIQEPFRRLVWSRGEFLTPEVDYDCQSTPLANLLIANLADHIESSDRNEVGRRALVQVLALRTWQLRHDGQFPDRLDQLVPEELPSLPSDPYTGRPFGYTRSEGQNLPSLRIALRPSLLSTAGGALSPTLLEEAEALWRPTPTYWLVYSVGPDLHDDRGRANGLLAPLHVRSSPNGTLTAYNYDLVFPVPPLEAASANRN